jgi:hypothetical protein
MAATSYTFLPWARRGLAARTAPAAADAPLPAHAKVTVGVTLTSLPESRYELTVHGPGDVLGVDPRLIIRTDPRPDSSDVEPNYLPLIEFDPPDFPWLFTPASAGPDDRLRPWCVLVVVDLSVVDPPRAEPGRPLPVLDVPAAVAGTELPDLAESWAWAHAQLIAPDGEDPAAALTGRPAMNVSRLLAPRRLEPAKRYAACLVPAFDAGVTSGLGGRPGGPEDPGAPLRPAWSAPPGADVTLPVYYHWGFSTGVAGDFEQLARRLRAFPVPAGAGGEPMFIGAAGPELPALPPADPAAYLPMDGALRTWQGSPGTLSDVPAPVQGGLRAALDAAAEQAAVGSTPTTPVLGPPVYGGWHARQHTVPADQPHWLLELNLDPRCRAAAGIGAEIVRQNQEQFVQWCWEQVEQVLETNRQLSAARLSMEALTRVHARHFAPLPEDRLLQLTAPLHSRARDTDVTVAASITDASVPDAAGDPALRRLTSPQRPVLRAAVGRTAPSAPFARQGGWSPRVRLVGRLAAPGGGLEVDPTNSVPHGLLGLPAMAAVPVDPAAETVDLTPIGLPVLVPRVLVNQVRNDTATVTTDPHPQLGHRDDLAAGVLGAQHVQWARDLQREVNSPWYSVYDVFGLIQQSARIIDPATIERLVAAVSHVADTEVVVGSPPPPFEALGMNTVGQALLTRTDPRVSVPSRLAGMVTLGTGTGLAAGAALAAGTALAAGMALGDASPGLTVAATLDRVLTAPRIDIPVYGYLARLGPERFLPGVGEIADDSITVLESNPRFVEALLVGLNDEMNRELLWRGFPTDQRGTPFRRFWDRPAADGAGTDIDAIHTWPAANGLGANGPGDPAGQVALLVRGQLLRRYPNTCLYAWRAHDGRLVEAPAVPDDLRTPVFAGMLGTDTMFVGFDLTGAELNQGEGWFFVLQEQPTEPRFGFDEFTGPGPLPALTAWSDATWQHTATPPGRYLRITGNPLSGTAIGDVRFADHAAHLAAVTNQQPMRIALHAGGLPELERT